jgi:hypothetical protein
VDNNQMTYKDDEVLYSTSSPELIYVPELGKFLFENDNYFTNVLHDKEKTKKRITELVKKQSGHEQK